MNGILFGVYQIFIFQLVKFMIIHIFCFNISKMSNLQ